MLNNYNISVKFFQAKLNFFFFPSFKEQLKLSESQNSSSTSIASTSASRPITPPNVANNGTESYVNMQQQSIKIIPPNKSSIAADKARKTGISNPVVNFGKFNNIYIFFIFFSIIHK